jgi:4-amino-4-deoxy-L-arabinose transferase-like glycosyltransferase
MDASGSRSPRLPLTAAPSVWIVGFSLLALALGSFRLGDKSLWVDEAASAGFALGGPSAWVADHNMGLYYALLGGVVRLFGSSEVALRSLSVACFVASVPALYAFVARAFGERAARIALGLYVSNAFILQFAQEARGYMLAVWLIILANLLLLRLLERRTLRWALLYGLTMGLALYAHLFALWIGLAHACALIGQLRRTPARAPLLCGGGLAVLLATPLLVQVVSAGTNQVSWIKPPTLRSALALPVIWSGGSRMFALIACGLFLLFVRGLRRTDADRIVAAWFVVPILASFVMSWLVEPVTLPKYLIMGVPALLVGAAVALDRLSSRALCIALTSSLLLCAATRLEFWYRHYQKERWREAVSSLAKQLQAGDALVLELPCPEPLDYYVQRLGLARQLPVPLWPRREWAFPTPAVSDESRADALAPAADGGRIWLVSNRVETPEAIGLIERTHRLAALRQLTPNDEDGDSLFSDSRSRTITLRAFVPRAAAP